MNFIAALTTFLVGFLGVHLFIGTDLACVFSITTMGYFILKKLDKINSINSEKTPKKELHENSQG